MTQSSSLNSSAIADQATGVRAALRDASWFRNPSTSASNRYHVVRGELSEGLSGCGAFVIATEGFPERDVTIAAETVLPSLRCARPGCKARWPVYRNEAKEGVDGTAQEAVARDRHGCAGAAKRSGRA